MSHAPPTVLRPDRPDGGPAIVLLGDAPARDALATELVSRGFLVALPARPDGDAAALEQVRAARDALRASGADPARLFVVGIGQGGTLAMVAPASVVGIAGAVAFGGPLVYPTLGPSRPAQPMDLLPGVRAPLQLHYGADDPLVPPHHVEQLRERLGRLGIAHQVLVYPGVGAGLLDPALPGHDPGAARTAVARAVRFLERSAAGVK